MNPLPPITFFFVIYLRFAKGVNVQPGLEIGVAQLCPFN